MAALAKIKQTVAATLFVGQNYDIRKIMKMLPYNRQAGRDVPVPKAMTIRLK